MITVPAVVLVAALAAVLVLKPWQSGGTKPPVSHRTTKAISYEPADNSGPAARAAGAQHGGQLTVLTTDSFDHLDPAQVYNFDTAAFLQLVTRSLTVVRTNSDGTGTLVGDLATDPGTDVNGDCKTWRYTIRTGIQFADGTPLTSRDVAYGIARSFDPGLSTGGYVTLQQWLAGDDDYSADYSGPGSGDAAAPGVHTPDERTLELTFPQPHCDLPYAVSLPTTAPVPDGSRPSATTIDSKPPSSGAYQVSSRSANAITLTRNPHWQAASDPVRTGDPDVIIVQLNQDPDAISSRLIADQDANQRTIAWSTTDTAAATATGRVATGSLGYNLLLALNTKRLTNLNVRKAISYAINKTTLVGESVGTDSGTVTSTLIPPGLAGNVDNPDPYPFDAAKGRALLSAAAGQQVQLTLATSSNSSREVEVREISNNLEAIGIKVTWVKLSSDDFYTAVAGSADPYDMALVTSIPDWPSGYEHLRNLFGRSPVWDVTHLSDPAIYAEFDRIDALPLDQQIAAAGPLDAKILQDTAAAVPLFTVAGSYLYGSHVGPVPVSAAAGEPDLLTAYVTG